MERYLGADVHAASVTFSVLDASGKQIRRDVVETNGKALVGYLQQLAGDLHLCLEEGEWSQWLYEILSPHVAELVVYRGEWKPGLKSDAIDAHGLAEKLRTGRISRPVYKDGRLFTALRDRARTYTMVTRDVARVKSRLKSFFRSRVIVSWTAAISDGPIVERTRLGLTIAAATLALPAALFVGLETGSFAGTIRPREFTEAFVAAFVGGWVGLLLPRLTLKSLSPGRLIASPTRAAV